jgi:hypothetical protein
MRGGGRERQNDFNETPNIGPIYTCTSCPNNEKKMPQILKLIWNKMM